MSRTRSTLRKQTAANYTSQHRYKKQLYDEQRTPPQPCHNAGMCMASLEHVPEKPSVMKEHIGKGSRIEHTDLYILKDTKAEAPARVKFFSHYSNPSTTIMHTSKLEA